MPYLLIVLDVSLHSETLDGFTQNPTDLRNAFTDKFGMIYFENTFVRNIEE